MKKYYVAKSLCIFQTLSKAGLVCVWGFEIFLQSNLTWRSSQWTFFLQLAKHLQIVLLVHCRCPAYFLFMYFYIKNHFLSIWLSQEIFSIYTIISSIFDNAGICNNSFINRSIAELSILFPSITIDNSILMKNECCEMFML